MRRRRWHRIVAALIGGWTLVLSTSSVAMAACPTHGATTHGATTHGATTHGASAHAVLMAAMPMHHDATAPSGGHSHHAGHQCTCPGDCCGTAAMALADRPIVALPVVPVAVAAQQPRPAVGAPRASATHHRLPRPLGPPALRD
jgi:hypothetical protein